MPQYRYAFDADDLVVDVLALSHDRAAHNGPFTCAGCGDAVIAKTKGEHRVKHFAHKHTVACSNETYLHRLAKRAFIDTYTHCRDHGEPFLIELRHRATCDHLAGLFGSACAADPVVREYDLTRFYDGINEEQRDGEFIPDVLLYNTTGKNGTIYIEMAVTHPLSEKKWESGQRIIELDIRHESDIARIRSKRLAWSGALFLNFAAKPVALAEAECPCARKKFSCFFVKDDGRCLLRDFTPAGLATERRRLGDRLIHLRVHDSRRSGYLPQPGPLFRTMVEAAQRDGVCVRNCFLCRYQGDNRSWDADVPVFCKFRRIRCNSNEAAVCEFFRLRHDLPTPSTARCRN